MLRSVKNQYCEIFTTKSPTSEPDSCSYWWMADKLLVFGEFQIVDFLKINFGFEGIFGMESKHASSPFDNGICQGILKAASEAVAARHSTWTCQKFGFCSMMALLQPAPCRFGWLHMTLSLGQCELRVDIWENMCWTERCAGLVQPTTFMS